MRWVLTKFREERQENAIKSKDEVYSIQGDGLGIKLKQKENSSGGGGENSEIGGSLLREYGADIGQHREEEKKADIFGGG